MTVRVRFAPSPTGDLHIGSVRTVVFDYLLARHFGGTFILRIEDTDQKRYVPGSVRAGLEGLAWLGITFDEGPTRQELAVIGEDWEGAPDMGGAHGPYVQSLRRDIYKRYAEELVEAGWAYRCNCSSERLAAVRRQQLANKQQPGYDRLCRSKKPGQVSPDEAHVIRLAVPLEGSTSFHDIIKGDVTVDNRLIDDQVLLKSDGLPTYHLAVVVDDHLMHITHVTRGDDWLPSAPKHVLLYQALAWRLPEFAHVPNVLATDGRKLSKRHGATSIAEFREQGFLPEALFNFLAFLGWAPGAGEEQEIFSRDELARRFSLEHVNKAGAIFAYDKLDWMNGVYIRSLSHEELARRMLPYLAAGLGLSEHELGGLDKMRLLAPLVQERLKRLVDVVEWCGTLFVDFAPLPAEQLVGHKMDAAASLAALRRVRAVLEALPEWSAEAMEGPLRELTQALGLKTNQLFGIVRVAATGKSVAPPLFGSLVVLGREKTLARLCAAEKQLMAIA